MLSPFLFVMEALTNEIREDLPWKILYADGSKLVADSMKSLKRKVLMGKEGKGMPLNVKKTKIMLSRENCGETDKGAKWPCVMCGGVVSNSIQCISCNEWMHKRYSGMKSHLRTV